MNKELMESKLKRELEGLEDTLKMLDIEIKKDKPDFKLVEILCKSAMRQMFNYGLV